MSLPHHSQSPIDPCDNWVDLARRHAIRYADKLAFCFIGDDSREAGRITYAEVDRRARAAAVALQRAGVGGGARALLLFDSGIDYIVAFFGCAYAGVIAVPAYPPMQHRQRWRRLEGVADDAGASAILATRGGLDQMAGWLDGTPVMQGLQRIALDEVDEQLADAWTPVAVDGRVLAYLQYTSGSTGQPKGVMVTHANLLHNQRAMVEGFGIPREAAYVTWLPIFHDMGLIGTILQPFYLGSACFLMSPFAFVKRPTMWLDAISRYRALVSWAPNFAYDLCAMRVSAEEKARLDLTCWRVAANAAEPVRADTFDRFARAFAECGLAPSAMSPSYGLAEGTLLVSATPAGMPAVTATLDAAAFGEGRVRAAADEREQVTVASSGRVIGGQTVRIVDPETCEETAPDRVGEIWVKGDSVARGYWQKPAETARTFANVCTTDGEGPFLRTGDLGFLLDGELFVSGRLKDIIIVRGQNYYPQDLEYSAFTAHHSLRPGNAIAFGFEQEGEERVAIVQEVRKGVSAGAVTDQAIDTIRRQLLLEHGLAVSVVALIEPDYLPKTSSGKIQRRLCRRQLEAGELPVLARWDAIGTNGNGRVDTPATDRVDAAAPPRVDTGAPHPAASLDALEQTVRRALIGALSGAVDPAPDVPLTAYGLDSLSAFRLVAAIEADCGVRMTLPAVLAAGTLRSLVGAIALDQRVHSEAPRPDAQSPTAKPELRHEPFPLTDMQQAYWVGRASSVDLGGVSLQIHLEIDMDAFDARRFEGAWQAVIDRHEMLRAVVLPSGEQAILRDRPVFHLDVTDLEGPARDARRRLARIRRAVTRTVLPLDRWPSFDVRAFRLHTGHARVLMHLDGTFVDFRSLQVLIRDLIRFYQAPETIATTRPPVLSYRDHVVGQIADQESDAYLEDLSYWRSRAAGLPPRPDLPLVAGGGRRSGVPLRHFTTRLERRHWEPLRARIAAEGLTPASFFMALYAEAIGRHAQAPQFTLSAACLNRRNADPAVYDVVGNFSTFALVPVRMEAQHTFLEHAHAVQRELHDAIEHSRVSGVRVLRELFRRQASVTAGIMPVVFTHFPVGFDGSESSLLTDIRTGLGTVAYWATQTPQIWLDGQIWYEDGDVVLRWDAATHLFPAGLVADMFRDYAARLHHFASDGGAFTGSVLVADAPRAGATAQGSQDDRIAIDDGLAPVETGGAMSTPGRHAAVADLEDRLVQWIRELTGFADVRPGVNLVQIGMTSLHVVLLALKLRDELSRDVTPAELFRYPTISLIARHFAGDGEAAGLAAATAAATARRRAAAAGRRRRPAATVGS